MANKFTILNLRELCFITGSEPSDNTQSQPHPHTSQEQACLQMRSYGLCWGQSSGFGSSSVRACCQKGEKWLVHSVEDFEGEA